MKLAAYIEEQTRTRKSNKTWILRELAANSGVSYGTLIHVEGGGRMQNYQKAKLVETATNGLVTIKELCED